jgi:membrane protease YdiL (CAAX protease family)
MDTQNSRVESRISSTDPIAAVRLWTVLPLLLLVGIVVGLLPSPPLHLENQIRGAALFATIVVWWLDVVAGATRRAGFQPSTPNVGALLKLSAKVAVCVLLAKLVWFLLEHALGLPRLGLVTGRLAPSEPTAQSFVFDVFLVALLAPVAEEVLFRGALFRKWRLFLGPGRAALVTSVVFGLAHASAPTAFLSALSLAVLYTTTRTIWAPVAAHMLNNLFSVALSYSAHLLPLAVLQAATDRPLQLASLVPGLLGTWWLVRFLRRGWHTLGDPVHGEPVTVGALAVPAR